MYRYVFSDAVVVSSINCMTSLFGGFAMFSVIGFMAHTLHKDVKDVVSSGELRIRLQKCEISDGYQPKPVFDEVNCFASYI